MRLRRDEQTGQVIPALLLVVVALLFLGLLFAQVGSAGDHATQAQTAADSAAVADAHILRDAGISQTIREPLPAAFAFGPLFAQNLPTVVASNLSTTACDTAASNWSENHRSTISCGDVLVSAGTGTVTVKITGPADQVVHGPTDVSSERPKARATARVVLAECPVLTTATPEGVAVAHWIAQTTATAMGGSSLVCFTPQDAKLLEKLALLPVSEQLGAVGPPTPIVNAATHAFRAQIVR